VTEDLHRVANARSDELSDVEDRGELRSRYYNLLQELRVILPGVQVLMAFLFTAPFAARFEQLDDVELAAYFAALACSVLASVTFIMPTAFHRAAGPTVRSSRLVWSVRMTVAGLFFLAGALIATTYCVTHFVFGGTWATTVTIGLAAAISVLWLAIPMAVRRARNGSDGDGAAGAPEAAHES
jgi:hypothetical protein